MAKYTLIRGVNTDQLYVILVGAITGTITICETTITAVGCGWHRDWDMARFGNNINTAVRYAAVAVADQLARDAMPAAGMEPSIDQQSMIRDARKDNRIMVEG